MHLKSFFIVILIFLFNTQNVYAYAEIRAENNAYRHNNKGLIYLKENYYFGAIKEFQIAIDLMPEAQGSAVYYVNLGTTYEKIGYPSLAQPCYEKALKLHPLFFDYYVRVAKIYKKLGIIDEKLEEYQNKKYNPLNNIMIGVLLIQKGEISTGITLLDNFCNEEEKLIITPGVREYIKKIVKQYPEASKPCSKNK